MKITAGQCRAARALLNWKQSDLRDKTGVSQKTIADFELGARTPYARTLRDITAAFEAAGIVFLESQDTVGGPGLRLKWGVEEPRMHGSTKAYDATQADDASTLDALAWDAEDYPTGEPPRPKPLPPLDWSDDDKRAQIEHWRSRSERWAALAEISRQCLLRAMGVDVL
jgi:transcriptional regulator with XRE-family HTH domain